MVEKINGFGDKPNARIDFGAINDTINATKNAQLAQKLREAIKTGKHIDVSPEIKEKLNEILANRNNKPLTYQQKVDKDETTIQNLLEKGQEPLKRPDIKPSLVTEGPNGGKLEQFPQRANGTYYTIETLPNGETYESTYSETGTLLNQTRRNSLSTEITTFNNGYTDKVTISNLQGTPIVGKIQAGNAITQAPPNLAEVTGKSFEGFRTK